MLFDGDGNRMTPSHVVKKGMRYRYYVSRSLITKDRTDDSAGLRDPRRLSRSDARATRACAVRLSGWSRSK
jgi:hypothetical protein